MRQVSPSEAIRRKYPETIGMVVTVGPDDRPNIITLGWVMQTFGSPLMFAISIAYPRYSYETIRHCREFVLAWPSAAQEEAMLFCGTHSGRDRDKFRESGLEAVPAKVVRPPLIAGALANYECRVVAECASGDHVIFVGEVVAAHVEDSVPQEDKLYNFPGRDFRTVVPRE